MNLFLLTCEAYYSAESSVFQELLRREDRGFEIRVNDRFVYLTEEQIKALHFPGPMRWHVYDDNQSYPEADVSYNDWRKRAPHCFDKFSIRDYQNCSASQAIAAVGVMETLLCIHFWHNITRFSVQMPLDCDPKQYTCMFGTINDAFKFLTSKGDATDECYPFVRQQCACLKQCYDGSAIKTTRFYSYEEISGYYRFMQAVAFNPTATIMTVFEDFLYYAGGVYRHISGQFLGGQAVLIVGWGTENGTSYWICQANYGSSFGEYGYFKILRGSNECGIEETGYLGYY